MTITRKVKLEPSFKPVEEGKEAKTLGDEIGKIRPIAEITLEGLSELAKGKILDWQPSRKFFTVEWVKKSEKFDLRTEKNPGLRAYFKIQLFTTQLVFKSTTVRRVDDDHSHFRIPEQLFHQQMRGALRVPLIAGRATLRTPRGEFTLVDLSVGGAKIILPDSKITAGMEIGPCVLNIGSMKITSPDFKVRIARTADGGIAGVRFSGLEEKHNMLIKQFLIDALKTYYEAL